MHHHNTLDMDQPREKWIKKRTSVKIRNGAPNHRANDLIVKEGNAQVVSRNNIFFIFESEKFLKWMFLGEGDSFLI